MGGLHGWSRTAVDIRPVPVYTIVVYPDYGHPSSIWPSEELVTANSGAYVLPHQIGMSKALEDALLSWTKQFQQFFLAEQDDFNARPHWRPGVNPYEWYDEGYRIVNEMRLEFPDVHIKPMFGQYIFSVNERRENMGLPPVQLPNETKPGHISIADVAPTNPQSPRH